MSFEGLAQVQARISSIEARISSQVGRSVGSTARPLGIAGATSGATDAAAPPDFATALSSALSPATGLRPAEVRRPGGYGPLTPPPELARYGNGRIPATALAPLGIDNHRLYAPAATAFRQMAADAAQAGVDIGVTDSYRSYDQQVALAEEKGLYRNGGLAAVPGTSAHGWGLATDLDLDDRALAWMRANAARYGFVEDTPREPWHWTFRPG